MKNRNSDVPYQVDPENPALNNILLANYILSEECQITPTQKLIMLTIFHHRNVYRFDCYPGLATISKESRLNRRTVQRNVDWLNEAGYLFRVPVYEGKEISRTYYFAAWDMEQAKEVFDCDNAVVHKDGCSEEFEMAYDEYREQPPF